MSHVRLNHPRVFWISHSELGETARRLLGILLLLKHNGASKGHVSRFRRALVLLFIAGEVTSGFIVVPQGLTKYARVPQRFGVTWPPRVALHEGLIQNRRPSI